MIAKLMYVVSTNENVANINENTIIIIIINKARTNAVNYIISYAT